jgi:hypothetical protein
MSRKRTCESGPEETQRTARMMMMRVFGGEVDDDDDVSLCAPMLQVVLDLFDDVDYVDP